MGSESQNGRQTESWGACLWGIKDEKRKWNLVNLLQKEDTADETPLYLL